MPRPSWNQLATVSGSVTTDSQFVHGGTAVGRRVASTLLGPDVLREAMDEARSGRSSSEAAWSLLSLLKPTCVQDWLVEEMLTREDLVLDDFTTGSLFASVVDQDSVPRIRSLMASGRDYPVATAARALRELLLSGCDVHDLAKEVSSMLPNGTLGDGLRHALDEALVEGLLAPR